MKDKIASAEIHGEQEPVDIMTALKASIREAQQKRKVERQNDSSDQREIHVILGDSTKGGRPATQEEKQRLSGTQDGGVPKGLSRCLVCGEWKGECLDPEPQWEGLVMTCHCICEQNLCRRCGLPVYRRKLGASYYDETDGRIWFVPSFAGMTHKCSK